MGLWNNVSINCLLQTMHGRLTLLMKVDAQTLVSGRLDMPVIKTFQALVAIAETTQEILMRISISAMTGIFRTETGVVTNVWWKLDGIVLFLTQLL